ncbi:hypothetical protein J416_14917 [Gracilibacillus halophilus YIM-C55.5]|uniref:Uroporphyrin-III C-methyltransferase n=1 Tax=Gracilibacillus halophilus YIM-C55.5 TaxID=1308866 RepID=N4WR16_9BACI|nr:DUF488 family protein [Gracilibacillus halophilus]ENH95661.1 hypothetical protein J416_14917 [Gracilibacillus halophilus YIM-C55.5]
MKVKRVYEETQHSDQCRILVDRVWPRGVSKERAQLDVWLKEIGPSPSLRKWFGHDPNKFHVFKEKYLEELEHDAEKKEAFATLKSYYDKYNGNITLVFATKEMTYNHVVILKEQLEKDVKKQ